MSEFGKQDGGGRRSKSRLPAGTSGVFTTITRSQAVFVREVSLTGARLEGPSLPEQDEEFVLTLGSLKAFAMVKWVRGTMCGVQFDVPLGENELRQLKREAPVGMISRQVVEMKQAYEDWVTGAAR